MLNLIKKVPIPMSGLALAFASLGLNLEIVLVQFSGLAFIAKFICGTLAVCILLGIALRVVFDWKGICEDYKQCAIWTVTPTFFMACMILAVYLKPYISSVAFVLWACALALQLMWVFAFFWRYLRGFSMNNILPSWFIVSVGYVVGTVTSVAFNMAGVGIVLLYLGLLGFLMCLPLVLYRFFIVKGLLPPQQPLAGIFLAPANLCLAGYLSLVGAGVLDTYWILIGALLVLSVLSFVLYALYCVPRMFKRFYPSFSAFTFPIVITSVAYTHLSQLLMPQLSPVATAFQVMATCVVLFVFARYLIFLFAPPKPAV